MPLEWTFRPRVGRRPGDVSRYEAKIGHGVFLSVRKEYDATSVQTGHLPDRCSKTFLTVGTIRSGHREGRADRGCDALARARRLRSLRS
jgi:hypothetical protein